MWPVLALLLGLGLPRALGASRGSLSANAALLSFWTGWAWLLIALQLWSLWLPVNWGAVVPVAVLAGCGLARNGRSLCSNLLNTARRRPKLAAGLILLALFLANRAILTPKWVDTGLYYLTAIRWAKAYPVVPGLGNLHEWMAFNQSHFLYAALLDSLPFPGRGYRLANGVLLIALVAACLGGAARLRGSRGHVTITNLFWGLMLVPTWMLVLGRSGSSSKSLSSPSPDVVVFALTAVVSAQLLRLVTASLRDRQESNSTFTSLVLLCCVGTTVKLSFAGFAVAAVAVALWAWWRNGRELSPLEARDRSRALVLAAACCGAVLIPWMARGVVLSGYPAYPLAVAGMPVEWRLPPAKLVAMTEAVKGPARAGVDTGWQWSLRGWSWVRPWLKRVARCCWWEIDLPVALIGMSLALFALYCRRDPPGDRGSAARTLVLLPPVAGVAFWFLSAPEPRFGMGSVWALGAMSAALAWERAGHPPPGARAGVWCARRVGVPDLVGAVGQRVSRAWLAAQSLGLSPVGVGALARALARGEAAPEVGGESCAWEEAPMAAEAELTDLGCTCASPHRMPPTRRLRQRSGRSHQGALLPDRQATTPWRAEAVVHRYRVTMSTSG